MSGTALGLNLFEQSRRKEAFQQPACMVSWKKKTTSRLRGQEVVEKPGSGANYGTITYARNALMATINQPQGSAVFKNWPCVTFV